MSIQILFDFNFFERISFKYLILISLLSSFSLFCFLYKFSILYTFDIIKYIILIACSSYLNLSFNYYFGFAVDNIDKEIFIQSCILPILISFILLICKIFNYKSFFFNVVLSFFLCFLSILHMDYLFKKKNYNIDDYPIINICFFIDIVITTLYFLMIYISSKTKATRTRVSYFH